MSSGGLRRAWLVIPLVLTMLVWSAVLPAGASTADPSPNTEPCPSVPVNLHLGTATPVLLVHGFNEGPDVFTQVGSPTLDNALGGAFGDDVKVVTFDYSKWSRLWVTFTLIGPQLAKCITWLAHTSAQQQGPGQVIIVAHSMGGLAVRCAVDAACASGTPAVNPSLIGLVITLGTPNTGSQPQTLGPVLDTACTAFSWCNDLLIQRDSPAAQAMVTGSSELTKLPLLPAAIPVDAIAGQIKVVTNLFGKQHTLNDLGDIAVPVASALADAKQGALHDGPGANKTTVNCGTISVTQLPGWIKASASKLAPALPATCWHVSETTSSVWQGDIISAIKAALPGLCTPAALLSALAAKDPTSAAQRTLVTKACADGWAVAKVQQPLTLSDGSVVQDTGVVVLKRTDAGWVSEGLSDGTCLVAPSLCPGVVLPPPAVLHHLLEEAGLSVAPTQAELYINTVFTPGALYKYPTGPSKIGIDNHNWIDGLQWTAGSNDELIGNGTLHYDDCNPSCAGGTYHIFPVRITASQPQQCNVQLYPNGLGNPSQTVNADVFNQIDMQALQGNPPSFLAGTSVLPGPCK